jgi:hypothetical protein
MNPGRAHALAWTLSVVAIGLLAVDVVFGFLGRNQPNTSSSWNTDLVVGVTFGATLVAFPVIGLVLAVKVRENPIGWLLLVISVCWGIGFGTTDSDYGLVAEPGAVPGAAAVGDIASTFWIPSIGLMGTFLFLLFPTGHLLSPRWRWVAWISGATIVVTTVAAILSPGDMGDVGYKGHRNPLGIESLSRVLHLVNVVLLLLPVTILLSAISLILRYRRSVGIERQQMKWLAGAAGAVALVWGVVVGLGLVLELGSDTTPGWLSTLQDISLLSFVLVPVAIGFGVLRYRLYEIDVIVRRTLIYTVLIAMLAALYLGGIALLGTATRELTGQSSALAVTISTLVVAAAFQPLRSRVQRAVEHRFYRKTYDAELAVQAFSNHLREEIELDTLSHALLTTVQDTVQPRTISIWLRP